MEEDQLEKLIRSKRALLDDKKAPKHLWTEISKELPSDPKGTGVNWKYMALLLGFIIIALLSYILFFTTSQIDDSGPAEILEFAEIPEFKETEEYYLSAIFVSEKKLYERHNDKTLQNDLSLLDENNELLKKEYKEAQGIYKEHVLRAIINNYKTKLEILQRVLQNIQDNEIEQKIY